MSAINHLKRKMRARNVADVVPTRTKELHIAPMLHYSGREFRALMRIFSRRAILWTEMVCADTAAHASNLDEHLGPAISADGGRGGGDSNTNALAAGGRGDHDNSSEDDHDNDNRCGDDNHNNLEGTTTTQDQIIGPVVCQIGGSDPTSCAEAAAVAFAKYGYDEINLNVDCPSERVAGKGAFGACLMRDASLVRSIANAMGGSGLGGVGRGRRIVVSIKCRIGVDDHDDFEFISSFISSISHISDDDDDDSPAVCNKFYLHARKCVLGGLMNARGNRSVPPLNYPRVYDLCRRFPECEFWINGGIRTLVDARRIAYGDDEEEGQEEKEDEKKEEDTDEDETNQSSSTVTKLVHAVPCHTCNLPYGSCTAPPSYGCAPPNLRGVMMGRAAVDDPCLFFDADRYFYGENDDDNKTRNGMNGNQRQHPPVRNRRDVLERYCTYLERTYPRRCCDDDERETYQYPAPKVVTTKDFCRICEGMHSKRTVQQPQSPETAEEAAATTTTTANNSKHHPKSKKKKKPKMAGRIIARSLKPIAGIFNNVPNSREFRRTCDRLGRDTEVRNCGPAFILRKAMEAVPAEVLDREFVSEEEIHR